MALWLGCWWLGSCRWGWGVVGGRWWSSLPEGAKFWHEEQFQFTSCKRKVCGGGGGGGVNICMHVCRHACPDMYAHHQHLHTHLRPVTLLLTVSVRWSWRFLHQLISSAQWERHICPWRLLFPPCHSVHALTFIWISRDECTGKSSC